MADFDINGDMIRKLAGLLEETGLSEIEYVEGERRVRVTRGGAVAHYQAPPPVAPVTAAAAPAAPAAAQPAAAAAPTAAHAGAVTSPMVGTAYLSPEPGAPAFVTVGTTVREGQTLLIIEAMKVMNPIKAPKAGTVTQILIADAHPVEFGEVLMIIE